MEVGRKEVGGVRRGGGWEAGRWRWGRWEVGGGEGGRWEVGRWEGGWEGGRWEVGGGKLGVGGRVGRWEGGKVGGGRWEGGQVGSEWEGYVNEQVRFDRFDRRSDSMPVLAAVGWLGMITYESPNLRPKPRTHFVGVWVVLTPNMEHENTFSKLYPNTEPP